MNRIQLSRWGLVLMLACSAAAARAEIKLGYIDPLSGMMAATGDHGLRELQFAVSRINERGGILGQKLEVVAMDNKLSPQESLLLFAKSVDEGVRYLVQGDGSSVAGSGFSIQPRPSSVCRTSTTRKASVTSSCLSAATCGPACSASAAIRIRPPAAHSALTCSALARPRCWAS